MAFEWQRMGNTPEGKFQKAQDRDRNSNSLESLASEYDTQAQAILDGPDKVAVSEEISAFAKQIASAREGIERDDLLEQLTNRIIQRKPGVLAFIPDDKRERSAFALSLVGVYRRSLQ